MRQYIIAESIRSRAWKIAKERQDVAEKVSRINGRFCNRGDLEIGWQGCIAELIIGELFPLWKVAQPWVVQGADTLETDFITPNKSRVEIKCSRFSVDYPTYFINVRLLAKKPSDYVLCTTINNSPDRADTFGIVGYMTPEEIRRYPVRNNLSSPAYVIPISDIESNLRGLQYL